MSFAPDILERLSRARSDLRMGVPILLTRGDEAFLALAVETLDTARLEDVRTLGNEPILTITSRRAETLKARAYDGDIARVRLPQDADLAWLRGIADPADDLNKPMKGPLEQPSAKDPR